MLKDVQGLSFVYFDEGDVVRHHLVQRIIRAYDEHKGRPSEQQMELLDPRPPNGNGEVRDIVQRPE